MEDQNVAIRLKGFIDSQGLTYSQFADQCGIPRPSLSQLLSGRNKKISDVLVGQIHHAFPKLSVLWLLFGEGDMEVTQPSVSNPEQSLFDESSFNDDEIVNYPDNRSGDVKYENVSGLSATVKSSQRAEYKLIEAEKKIVELQKQIDKIKQNPRKVTQITVYYDDSTFETFYPQ